MRLLVLPLMKSVFRPLRRHTNSREQEEITTEQVENDPGLVSTKSDNNDEIPYFI